MKDGFRNLACYWMVLTGAIALLFAVVCVAYADTLMQGVYAVIGLWIGWFVVQLFTSGVIFCFTGLDSD